MERLDLVAEWMPKDKVISMSVNNLAGALAPLAHRLPSLFLNRMHIASGDEGDASRRQQAPRPPMVQLVPGLHELRLVSCHLPADWIDIISPLLVTLNKLASIENKGIKDDDWLVLAVMVQRPLHLCVRWLLPKWVVTGIEAAQWVKYQQQHIIFE